MVIGCCLIVLFALMPTQISHDAVYALIGLSSCTLVVVGVRINRPADRLAWYLVAGAGLCFSLGDLAGDYFTDVVHRATPVPSVADAFYLLGYPFLFAGVIRLSRNPVRRARREDYADAAVIALGSLTLAWHFLLESYVHEQGVSTAGRLVALAYPIMDVALIFVLFRSVIFGDGPADLPVVVDGLHGHDVPVRLHLRPAGTAQRLPHRRLLRLAVPAPVRPHRRGRPASVDGAPAR